MTRARIQLAVVGLCLAMFAVGCSSSDAATSANYVAVPAAGTAETGSTAPAATDPATSGAAAPSPATPDISAAEGAPVDEITAVVQVFDAFLELRARAITHDAELAELEAVATPAAIEQVVELRSENDTRIADDSYAVRTSIAEWSNISVVAERETDLYFRDCTESQHVTPGGFTVVNFVTTDVSIVEVDGTLKVDNLVVVQDGVASTSDEILGCVPPSFIDRATAVAELAVDEAERLIESPAASLAAELPSVFAAEARTDLEDVRQSLSNQGLSRVADEIVDYTVLGMDVNRPDFTVVVSVCRTYPTGRTFTDKAGAETTTDLATGSSFEEWVYVHLQAVPSSDTADVVTEVYERGPNCERG